MLRKDQNELLTQTGPGTPTGRLFRSYWIPALQQPGYVERDRQMLVETEAYALPSGELVYSALTKTINPVSSADLVIEVGQNVAKDMSVRRLIGR